MVALDELDLTAERDASGGGGGGGGGGEILWTVDDIGPLTLDGELPAAGPAAVTASAAATAAAAAAAAADGELRARLREAQDAVAELEARQAAKVAPRGPASAT